MQESITLLLIQIRMIWRFRWLALCLATLVSFVGWIGVMALPDQFEVSTKVFLDTSSMLRPLLKGLAADNRMQEDSARMMQRTLLVRPNLEAVARKTDLDLKAKTPEEFEALLNGLAKRIVVSGTSRDNIFVISYKHSDPELANKVVEAILNLFVERSLGKSRQDTGKTKLFIDKQIAEYESRLTAAESRLKEFKQQNVGMMPQDGQTYYSRMQAAASNFSSAKLALEEATRRRDEFKRQIEGVEPLFETEIGVQNTRAFIKHPLDGRIAALETQIDQLLVQYTEKHPDVVSSKGIMEGLKKQREEDIKNNPPPAPVQSESSGQSENQVYQEISLALGNAEAEVAALAARSKEYSRREQELRKLVDTIPRIEAELARLNRDYEVNKRNYDELVKRRESLSISEQASQTSDSVKFNIIEPPRVPLVPTGPNRPLFSTVVIIAGLGLGAGLAWLLAILRPTIYTKEEIEQLFQIPVIGTVTRIWTPAEVFRRRVDVFAFTFGGVILAGIFAGVVMVEMGHPELLLKARQFQFADQISSFVDNLL